MAHDSETLKRYNLITHELQGDETMDKQMTETEQAANARKWQRDQLALAALAGIIANTHCHEGTTPHSTAAAAYAYADAMLAASEG